MRDSVIGWYTSWVNFWFDNPLFFFFLVGLLVGMMFLPRKK